uniref:Uncharacterized protein n=1 Tax=Amphimedon queenslandica TaxID=400682 RepID=A0A1X7UVB1_AMPQE
MEGQTLKNKYTNKKCGTTERRQSTSRTDLCTQHFSLNIHVPFQSSNETQSEVAAMRIVPLNIHTSPAGRLTHF